MKAVMYHYVRKFDPDLPYFAFLNVDSFKKQLDYFEADGGFVAQDEFLNVWREVAPLPDGYVLTFDDGFRDHFDFVLPELKKRGLWGIFYVCTGPYTQSLKLAVHRIHHILGARPATEILAQMRTLIKDEMLTHKGVAAFQDATYPTQDLDGATKEVKRTLNYYLSNQWRDYVIDELVKALGVESQLKELYLSEKELQTMQDDGMLIGSHSVTHPVFSKLSESEQANEIDNSFDYLESTLGRLTSRTFCYPYGRAHSFTSTTEALLDDASCEFGFAVEPRDINEEDVKRRQALPRYDCNQFVHGKVQIGSGPES
jgi:peptidoglycan/xylan/chitin deacetylase (PgdA/CDA1 family)